MYDISKSDVLKGSSIKKILYILPQRAWHFIIVENKYIQGVHTEASGAKKEFSWSEAAFMDANLDSFKKL